MFKNNNLCCSICKQRASTLKKLSSHFQHVHRVLIEKANLDLQCTENNCNRNFVKFKSFSRHIRIAHSSFIDSAKDDDCSEFRVTKIAEEDNLKKIQAVASFGNDSLQNADTSKNKSVESSFNTKKALKAIANQTIADTRIHSQASGAELGRTFKRLDQFANDLSDFYENESKKLLKSSTQNEKSDSERTILNTFDHDKNLFDNAYTLRDQIRAVKNSSYSYIEPTTSALGFRIEQRLDRASGTYQKHQVYESVQYTSIIDILKLILSHDEIIEFIDKESSSGDDDLITNFKDGKAYKSHPIFKKFPNIIRLNLYFDEITVNNPLGGSTYAHKLGNFYFTIQNLPPYLNSLLENIHVLVIAHSADIMEYGFEKVLAKFLGDLKKLESDEGVRINVKEKAFVLRATLAAFCGDGLAAHQILGFLSPAANHFCRFCTIHREDFHNNDLSKCEKRTSKLYDEQLNHVMNSSTNKEREKRESETGVKSKCALNISRFFSNTENMCFDMFHVLLQGLSMMESKLVLRHYVKSDEYDITIKLLNSRADLFNYGFMEVKNKPTPNFNYEKLMNTADHKLKQKGAQVSCLMRVLPFLIYDKVPSEDRYLKLILLLNRITEFAMSPRLRRSMLPYLNDILQEHKYLFYELFPEIAPINKLHELSEHLVDCIYMYGPIRHYNCNRFEAKHQLAKKRGSNCNNFKDIARTVMQSYQLDQSSKWGTNETKSKLFFDTGVSKKINDIKNRSFLINLGFEGNSSINITEKLKVNQKEYRKGYYLAIDNGESNEDGKIVFGKIEEIIIISDSERVYFICKKVPESFYEESLNSYCIEENVIQTLCCVSLDDLLDRKAFNLWQPYGSNLKYICLRHCLV